MIFKTQYFDYVKGNSLWHFYWFDIKQKHFYCSSYQKKKLFSNSFKINCLCQPCLLGHPEAQPRLSLGAQQGKPPDRCWEEMRRFPNYNKLN